MGICFSSHEISPESMQKTYGCSSYDNLSGGLIADGSGESWARLTGADLSRICFRAIRIADFSLDAQWLPLIPFHDSQTEELRPLGVVQIDFLNQTITPEVVLGKRKCSNLIHGNIPFSIQASVLYGPGGFVSFHAPMV